MKFVTFAKLWW